MPRCNPYTQCHTNTARSSCQPRLWLKNPTSVAGKYTRGIMKAQLMVARMVPNNTPLSALPNVVDRHRNNGCQQCGADPVFAHPGAVPVESATRLDASISISRRVSVRARHKDGRRG